MAASFNEGARQAQRSLYEQTLCELLFPAPEFTLGLAEGVEMTALPFAIFAQDIPPRTQIQGRSRASSEF